MSYTFLEREGKIIRDSDGVQILPCNGIDTPEAQEYIAWVQTGNQPTVVNTPTQEEILKTLKEERAKEVSRIVVTTSNGWVFDGDEISQGRMARAIVGLRDDEFVVWVLHSNEVVLASKEILQEALRLAGEAMTAIWVRPYL